MERVYIAEDGTKFDNRYECLEYRKLIYDLTQLSDRDDKYPKSESCDMIRDYVTRLLTKKLMNDDNLLTMIVDNHIKGNQLRKIFVNFQG